MYIRWMNDWSVFFAATAGAAAALTGLIFVGVSINLSKILIPNSTLPARALVALVLLFTILMLSICFLIPGQHNLALQLETVIVGVGVWLFVIRTDFSNYKKAELQFKHYYIFNLILNQLSTIPYLVAAVLLLTTTDAAVYFIALGFAISFLKAFADSWVLLVEINR